ncbi:UDP-N-acetylglucosamine pyrophosphorylase [Clostridium sp. E02]|uniref:UDP-N-acetylglucosamine pyrophosphorylase n=1 Tax=Clostridium sp. E02 TaxID=2487134 RepID=UPI000F525ECE|nr:UDP-N-acetylglucosamine pyrophosphorylase [Clostridium sp. E02]
MKKEDMKNQDLFDTNHTIAKLLFEQTTYPWEILPKISEFIVSLGERLPKGEYVHVGKAVWIHKSINLPPTACLGENVIIGKGAQIRHCAFLRGNVIIGEGAVIGNSSEIKNSILFDGVQVPHFNYVGDSILGYKSHMGASSIASNVKTDKSTVSVHAEDGNIDTELKKFGAIIGDYAEIGCGAVLNPGTVIGPKSNIYPLSCVRTCVDANSIYKNQGEVIEKNITEA